LLHNVHIAGPQAAFASTPQHDLVFPDVEAWLFSRVTFTASQGMSSTAGFFIDEVVVRRDVRVEDHDAFLQGLRPEQAFSANRLSVL
jgi:hypothetical protein